MKHLLVQGLTHLLGRFSGPMALRLLIQPTVATLLAVRAGLRDARLGRPPFLRALFMQDETRRSLLREAWHDLRTLLIVAVVLDVVYQIWHLSWFYPLQTVVVGTVVGIVPYVVFRGIVTRLAVWAGRTFRRPVVKQPSGRARPPV